MRPISGMGIRAALALTIAGVLSGGAAHAQTFTWTSAANGVWSLGGNWGGTGPAPGGGINTILNFGPNGTYTATNDLTGAFQLNQLNFTHASGTITIAASGGSSLNFITNGSAITPTIQVQGAGNGIISSPITLTNNTTVSSGAGGSGNLTFSGAITGGANNLTALAQGTVTFTGGGDMNTLSFQNGPGFISGGTYNLNRPTEGNAAAGLQIGAATGQNPTVTIDNGSVVNVAENVYVADGVAGNFGGGTLNVSGAGTVLNMGQGGGTTASGRLGVGNFGAGFLNITGGAVLNCDLLFNCRNAGSTGVLTVDGAGSQLNATTNLVTNSGQFTIGNQGVGSLTITNGGTGRGRNVIMGNTGITATTGEGQGTITVTGVGSQLIAGGATAQDSAGNMTVASGTAASTGTTRGTLNVLSGAHAEVNQSSLAAGGTLFSAVQPNSVGIINVTGAGSTLNVAGQFSLGGGGGAGTVGGSMTTNITSGGSITAVGLGLMNQSDGGGTSAINMDTGGLLTISGQFQANPPAAAGGANPATATISVLGGSNFTINNTAFFAIGTGGSATLTVNGTGSIFQTTGTGQIQFGGAGTTAGGTTTVNIGTGGTVQTSSDPAALTFVFAGSTVNVNSGGTLTSPTIGVDGRLIANGAVNGAVIVSATVGTTGFLGGTSGISGSIGTITGNVTVNSGGTIRPGDGSATGAGILTVTGAASVVSVASGANFSINVNGPTPGNGANNHAQLLLTSGATVDITGSTLQTTLGYAPNPGQVITFISGGAVTGTFNGLPENQLFQVGTFNAVDYFANIHYTPTTVFFTVVPEPMHVLGLGAVVCGGFTWWKKRRKAKAALAA